MFNLGVIAGRIVVPSTPWVPTDLGASLYAWYISDDAGNILSGSNYLSMQDKSANARLASVVGTVTNTGSIDSRSCVNINANAEGFSIASSQAFAQNVSGITLACVYTVDTGTISGETPVIFNDTSTSNVTRIALHSSGGGGTARPQLVGRRLNTDSIAKLQSPTAFAGPCVTIGISDYANSDAFLRVNGSLVASTTSWLTAGNTQNNGSANNVRLAHPPSGDSHRGDIGEWILCNSALSLNDAEKLEGYLAWQWGLEGSLPVDHPYKSAPPTV